MRYHADDILNAVEDWAITKGNYMLLREFGVFGNNMRLDGILLALGHTAHIFKKYKRHGLIGIEVKVSRSDFLHGLKNGQYEKYNKYCAGLFLATPRDVCKTSEIPEHCGHLICERKRMKRSGWPRTFCVCRRHPKYKPGAWDSSIFWRLIERVCQEHRKEIHKLQNIYNKRLGHVGRIVGSTIHSQLDTLSKKLDEIEL
ncbi:MmcB family DNA repair protein [bacterium]|nr:MmcB family DNA repair protein [bacterium]